MISSGALLVRSVATLPTATATRLGFFTMTAATLLASRNGSHEAQAEHHQDSHEDPKWKIVLDVVHGLELCQGEEEILAEGRLPIQGRIGFRSGDGGQGVPSMRRADTARVVVGPLHLGDGQGEGITIVLGHKTRKHQVVPIDLLGQGRWPHAIAVASWPIKAPSSQLLWTRQLGALQRACTRAEVAVGVQPAEAIRSCHPGSDSHGQWHSADPRLARGTAGIAVACGQDSSRISLAEVVDAVAVGAGMPILWVREWLRGRRPPTCERAAEKASVPPSASTVSTTDVTDSLGPPRTCGEQVPLASDDDAGLH
mmetsp:Transcript_16298/g.45097  ORF Transcript_16298/g.45097 Transcript_16298/m.45097 type:complete len:312 (+) Transcript_16298:438-1373(+)